MTKLERVKDYQRNAKDTGSTEVQIAIFTDKIKHLNEHCKIHKSDAHSRRGLILLVHKRKKLLSYLKRVDSPKYLDLLAKSGLRK